VARSLNHVVYLNELLALEFLEYIDFLKDATLFYFAFVVNLDCDQEPGRFVD
jgi:hypothetical protein